MVKITGYQGRRQDDFAGGKSVEYETTESRAESAKWVHIGGTAGRHCDHTDPGGSADPKRNALHQIRETVRVPGRGVGVFDGIVRI